MATKGDIKKVIIKVGGYTVFVLICFIFLNVYLSNSKEQRWIKDSKPFAENFIKLLKEKNNKILYQAYINKDSIAFDEFEINVNNLYQQMGNITSYKYRKGYPTYKGSVLDGLYLSYSINSNGMEYSSFFSVLLDKHSQLPVTGTFISFAIFFDDHGNNNEAFIIDFIGDNSSSN